MDIDKLNLGNVIKYLVTGDIVEKLGIVTNYRKIAMTNHFIVEVITFQGQKLLLDNYTVTSIVSPDLETYISEEIEKYD